MARPTHHFYVDQHKRRTGKSLKPIQPLDNLMLILSFVQPLTGVPQAIAVWQGHSASALTWILFTLFGFLSLAYGVAHKLWPIIVSNVIWTVIDLTIVIGILQK